MPASRVFTMGALISSRILAHEIAVILVLQCRLPALSSDGA